MPQMLELDRDAGEWFRAHCLEKRRETVIRLEIGAGRFSGLDDLTPDEARALRDWLNEAIAADDARYGIRHTA